METYPYVTHLFSVDASRRTRVSRLLIGDADTLTTTRKMIRVGGQDVDEHRFINDLRAKDLRATRYLVSQLSDDAKTNGSLGLTLVSRAFGPELHAFIYRLVDRDRIAADALFVLVLQRAIERVDKYDARRSAFRTWLYQQAKYAAADWRREQARVPPVAEPLPEDSAASQPSIDDLLTEAPTEAERAALRRAFRRLRPPQRDLLWWRFVEGWTPTEIARYKLEGAVVETHVKVYVSRALKRLTSLYEAELRSE